MTCGKLHTLESGHISGNYKVWGKPRLDFTFAKELSPSEKAPDYIVQAKDDLGEIVDIGVVYQNVIGKGEKTGLHCYSVYLNEPGLFKKPLKLSAFPTDTTGRQFSLEYETEKKQENGQQEPQQQAA